MEYHFGQVKMLNTETSCTLGKMLGTTIRKNLLISKPIRTMNRILKHIVLPSGLHAIQTRQDGSDIIRTEIFTEEEYQHFTWWNRTKFKLNLLTLNN